MRTRTLDYFKRNITFKLVYYHFWNIVFALFVLWFSAHIDFKVVSGWLLPVWHFNPIPVLFLFMVIALFRQLVNFFAFLGINEPARVLGMEISEFRSILKQISKTLGLRRQEFRIKPIEFENAAVIDRPFTPKDLILVPEDSPPGITRSELKALISHEIGHIKAHVGVQHIFQLITVSSIIAFIANAYILAIFRSLSEMSLFFAIIWLVPLTAAVRPIVNKVLNPIASYLMMHISHLNEYYADLIALSVAGPIATINMLLHLQDWAYKQWRISVLANLFTEVLKAKGAHKRVIEKCKSWVAKTKYDYDIPTYEYEKRLVLDFTKLFGSEIGLSPSQINETESLSAIIKNLLKLVPFYKRIAIRDTLTRLWKWDEYVPTWRQFDKQEPFGILDNEELSNFLRAIEDMGTEGINPVDLTTISHPTVLKRIEFILSISRS